MNEVEYAVTGVVDDVELNALHAEAFGHEVGTISWQERLATHSLFWVTARQAGVLVGFVNVIGDGGAHAVLFDTCVRPNAQRRGIGRGLIAAAADEARDRGCHWLHADYEPHLITFYEHAVGMSATAAGLLPLSAEQQSPEE